MKIDYSLPSYSKYLLHLDIGMQQGLNHLKLSIAGCNLGLSIQERITHLVLAILKFIPILGHLIAWVDKLYNANHIRILTLASRDPYEQGFQHGAAFKSEIQDSYRIILSMKCNAFLRTVARLYERNIPRDLIDEMRGLATGAEVAYEDVLFIHTFLDAQPGVFGCSTMARKFGLGEPEERIAAANHKIENDAIQTLNRRTKLLQSTGNTAQEILQSSNVTHTIQSIVFNPCAKSIDLSSSESDAAYQSMERFDSEKLFGHQMSSVGPSKMQLLRNLDWPWYFLGQRTLILSRTIAGKKVCSVTFPGYLGSLSGMNEDGVCLAACSQGNTSNQRGMPNTLLFTKVLARCATTAEALQYLRDTHHGSSMNLIIADSNHAESLELTGNTANIVGKIGEDLFAHRAAAAG